MSKSEINQSYKQQHEFSLGPLRWCFSSKWEAREHAPEDNFNQQTFITRLQILIEQALEQGCRAQDLNIILSQHNLGDQNVDA